MPEEIIYWYKGEKHTAKTLAAIRGCTTRNINRLMRKFDNDVDAAMASPTPEEYYDKKREVKMKPMHTVVDLGKTYEQNLIDSLQRLGYKGENLKNEVLRRYVA